jgi:hypothetical protein
MHGQTVSGRFAVRLAEYRRSGNQVGDTNILTLLEQQGGGLATVVGLVVEEVQQQGMEVLALRHATGVVIGQRCVPDRCPQLAA